MKDLVVNYSINLLGRRLKKKYLVIESDDWGSIRMPSKDVAKKLENFGFDIQSRPYEKFDSLEGEKDLEALFEILNQTRDSRGNNPIFTAMTIVANPDFEKIRKSNFDEFHYEPIIETFNRTAGSENVLKLYHEGINNKLFLPQFHGREHINVPLWMEYLRNNNSDIRIAFDHKLAGIFFRNSPEKGNIFAKALGPHKREDIFYMKKSISEGLWLFEQIFKYKPKCFMAPAFTWNDEIEQELYINNVCYLQSQYYQNKVISNDRKSIVYHYFGQKNKLGQHYLLRNCSFEPFNGHQNSVNHCLKEISIAFKLGKPATISTHRLNYIGKLHIKNRDLNLKLLNELLKRILRTWPDVEFVSSLELAKYAFD